MVNSGSTSITSFTYNAAGQRIEKTVNRDVTKYYYDDAGRLIGQTDGDRTIQFCWDMAANTMLGFVSGGVRYWYRKNQQGDVTGIFATNNAASEMLVEYEYTMPGAIVSPSPAQAQTLLASGTP